MTSGLAPGYVQANLIVLPSRYAADFRLLCERNPVPCPLIAESSSVGTWSSVKSYIGGVDGSAMLADVDIRRDAPKYNVYKDSKLVRHQCKDIVSEWTDDYVAFLIGCSFSFETALTKAGLPPRHQATDRNVPMYHTTLRLSPAGVFTEGNFVVSMRPYPAKSVEQVRSITRAYSSTHGEPVAWGWEAIAKLGIADIDVPEWGTHRSRETGSLLGRWWDRRRMCQCFGGVVLRLRKRLWRLV